MPRPESSALAYWEAGRPRIVGLVLLTITVAALVAGPRPAPWAVVANVLIGSAMVIVGAIALNQRLEHALDAKMARTAARPLPAGRLTNRQMTVFGAGASVAGLVYLAFLVNAATTWLASASWLIYVGIYTPSKRFTACQTAIGAVAGAMPTLLGAAAAGAPFSLPALTLFGIVYFWQFPHALAIGRLYCDQFATADVRLPAVVDPSGRSAGWLSLLGALALIPTSLTPVLAGVAGWGYGAVALLLGFGYLAAAVRFLRRFDGPAARTLLQASIVYLPLTLAALLAALLW